MEINVKKAKTKEEMVPRLEEYVKRLALALMNPNTTVDDVAAFDREGIDMYIELDAEGRAGFRKYLGKIPELAVMMDRVDNNEA